MNVYKFLGVIFLLVGVYASARTIANFAVFDKYPTVGALSFDIFGSSGGIYIQKESDCRYLRTYYDNEGNLRQANQQETDQEQKEQRYCLDGVDEVRNAVKLNDISLSTFFLLLGLGTLVITKQPKPSAIL